ncbi:DUF4406 domain-containing protein [Streptomyces sp. B1I3]|uniref:DUF4406 domain-containing protein n=1 Tax=Streptomyces sp. B1I3 TaxID=3042264 RepID=UPI002780F6DE|nr:DUF4406 domain-containing protein [Streptomyces sp. B1I3]MDQ0791758.1 hypothetical protein [Streptomyces sp. B1I3]
MTDAEPMLIPIAGPYRSGTGSHPQAAAADLARLEAAAWPVIDACHLWVPMSDVRAVGAGPTDPLADQDLHQTVEHLAHREAVLRLPGDCAGDDQDVAAARRRALPVHHDLTQIPPRTPQEAA